MQGLIDIHCHIVPGVDDGAKTLYDAGKILQMEYWNGVSAVIVTPHYRVGMFETPQAVIQNQFLRLKEMVSHSRSGMKVYLGCEYHSHSTMLRDLQTKKRPTMAGSRYVLTEFSSRHSYSMIRNQVYELVAARYKPIIAHVERYPCLLEDAELIGELIDAGAKIQVTSGSVIGEHGRKRKQFCQYLLKNDWVDYIASDAHDITHRKPNLKQCAEYVSKKYGEEYMKDIFIRNPQKIIREGQAIKRRRLENEKGKHIKEKTSL